MNTKKDPSDEREGGKIIEKAACCEDGCCSWHDNTTAQSEKVKTGDSYPGAPGGDD
jgi:hypothetical protein